MTLFYNKNSRYKMIGLSWFKLKNIFEFIEYYKKILFFFIMTLIKIELVRNNDVRSNLPNQGFCILFDV